MPKSASCSIVRIAVPMHYSRVVWREELIFTKIECGSAFSAIAGLTLTSSKRPQHTQRDVCYPTYLLSTDSDYIPPNVNYLADSFTLVCRMPRLVSGMYELGFCVAQLYAACASQCRMSPPPGHPGGYSHCSDFLFNKQVDYERLS
ncbi:unnamed protein product [Protopolystoma xenopodis]|uniref:Uncharacterized protein n=1 Tax=Protopolystoma xenopodis TaxID=117903 RepID=A0A448XCU9_9PLAT|nr:unnamed protein product [Protopolystoma xenopodis]